MNPACWRRSGRLRSSCLRWTLCAIAFLHLASACLFAQADAAAAPSKMPLRLAIAEFAVSKETESLRSEGDRKSTRLNSSHVAISYAVFCLKKKKQIQCIESIQTTIYYYQMNTASHDTENK